MSDLLPPIAPGADPEPALDVRALFTEGLAHVRDLSRALWTDHNTHDPGITTLELLCYALTDVAYRHTLPIADLLASETDNAAQTAAQFHAPRAILPNRACTELDWRKALIDVNGVKNAWIEPVRDVTLFADLAARTLRTAAPAHPAFVEVALRGLSRVRIEFMDTVNTQAERDPVFKAAREAVEAQRNLCEDVIEIRAVRAEYFALCAEVELALDADATEVAAQLLFAIGEELAPPVLSYTLDQMLARGFTLAEVFEGPLLEHGFIADDELLATALPAQLHLSDLMRAAMHVSGIAALRSFIVNPIQRADEADDAAPDADPEDVKGEAVPLLDAWRIPVRAGRLPRLSLAHGRLVFSKRGLPVAGWNVAQMPAAVRTRLGELREAARLRVETLASTANPPIPLGRARPLAKWHTVQHDFPALYGIGEEGLSARADGTRRAQAQQLQAWLLFFDQVMANQLALLAQARHRLSVNPVDLALAASRFAAGSTDRHALAAQMVEAVPGHDPLYAAGTTVAVLADLIESPAEASARQHRLLDHLLARVAEGFAEYAAIMASAFGHTSDRIIADKCHLLADVAALGGARAAAAVQRPAPADVWNTLNVSGLEQRVARLLGISDFSRRNLSGVSHDEYTEVDATPGDEWRFRVRHAVTHQIVLSSSTHYATPEAARAEMTAAIERGQQAEGYQRLTTSDGRNYFNIVDAGGEVLARRIQYFADATAMEAAIAELQTYLRDRYRGEGLYVVEHVLLRPLAADEPVLPICTDPACFDPTDVDPYSYRLHVVLPAFAGRFQNIAFRQFVEHTIRAETPAHILPTVCWINGDDMARFELAWREWLELQAGVHETGRKEKLQALIDALVSVKNVYPTRHLFDCTGDDTKPPFILGQTALGRGPGAPA